MTTELPAPLVPADVDLRGFEFMPLYGDRLFKSETWIGATPDAKIAMLRLWWHSYAHEVPAGSLPNNDTMLSEHAGYGVMVKGWLKVKAQAMRGYVLCSDGRWYHPVACSIALKSWEKKQSFLYRMNRRFEILSIEWKELRDKVFKRDNYTCQYCSARGVKLECDHVQPVSKGGLSVIENLVTACLKCNRSKGAKSLTEWRGQRVST